MTVRGLPLVFLFIASLAGCLDEPAKPDLGNDEPVTVPDVRPALVTPQLLAPVRLGTPGGGAEPNIAVAPDGTLYASSPLAVWRSTDNGTTWTQAKGTKLEGGGDGDIAVDATGKLYWLGLSGEDKRDIPFQVSTDRGESWSDAVDVSKGTGRDREWLDVLPNGTVYATWRGADGLEFVMSPDAGTTWRPKTLVHADANQGPLAHAPDGTLYNALQTWGEGAVPFSHLDAQPQLRVAASKDQGATWTAHTLFTFDFALPADANGYATDFPTVAVDANGTVYVTISADARNFDVNLPEAVAVYGIYLFVSKDNGTTWSEPRLLSAPDKAARFPWVAAGKAGRVAVAWYENEEGRPSEMLPDRWNVKLWESVSADRETVESTTVQLNRETVHVGPICTSGTGCLVNDRRLLDFFEIALTQEGQPVAAWASTGEKPNVPLVFFILPDPAGVGDVDVYFGGAASGTPLL